MKKILILVIILTIAIICITYVWYGNLKKNKQEVEKINNEFLVYKDRQIQINTLNTLMNKAIQYNIDNKVQQDEKNAFIENDTNSIKIYIDLSIEQITVPMERLLLNQSSSNRAEKVEFAFNDSLFILTNVEYHEKTGLIKSLTFKEILN